MEYARRWTAALIVAVAVGAAAAEDSLDLGKDRVYRGEVLEGEPHGEGTLTWPSGGELHGAVGQRRAPGQPAEPTETLIPITIEIAGTLAQTLRARASSGHSIGEIVAQALRRLFSDAGRHG